MLSQSTEPSEVLVQKITELSFLPIKQQQKCLKKIKNELNIKSMATRITPLENIDFLLSYYTRTTNLTVKRYLIGILRNLINYRRLSTVDTDVLLPLLVSSLNVLELTIKSIQTLVFILRDHQESISRLITLDSDLVLFALLTNENPKIVQYTSWIIGVMMHPQEQSYLCLPKKMIKTDIIKKLFWHGLSALMHPSLINKALTIFFLEWVVQQHKPNILEVLEKKITVNDWAIFMFAVESMIIKKYVGEIISTLFGTEALTTYQRNLVNSTHIQMWVKLLENSMEDIQTLAANILCESVQNQWISVKEIIAAQSESSFWINRLYGATMLSQEILVTKAIIQLCFDDTCRREIIKANGIANLQSLLGKNEISVLASLAIIMLIDDSVDLMPVFNENDFYHFFHLLFFEDSSIRQRTHDLLGNFEQEHHDFFLRSLTRILIHQDNDMRNEAADRLSKFLYADHTMIKVKKQVLPFIAQQLTVEHWINLLERETLPPKKIAIDVLTWLARSTGHRHRITNCGGIMALGKLLVLKDEGSVLQSSIVLALAYLARKDKNTSRQLVDYGYLPALEEMYRKSLDPVLCHHFNALLRRCRPLLQFNDDKPPRSISLKDLNVHYSHVLGGGAFGMVCKGTLIGAGDVAIKIIYTKKQEEIEKEMKLHDRFSGHPNIVTLYGVCAIDNSWLLVMELMEESLYNFLDKRPSSLPLLRMLFALGVASGLAHLHAYNVLHRDLKSQNIVIKGECVKLCDFGLSKQNKDWRSSFATGGAVGTRPWMAPELFSGSHSCTRATDIYSLAIILWELMSGSHPYENRTEDEIIALVRDGDREVIPPETHPDYRALIEMGWHQEAKKRPMAHQVVHTLKICQSKISPAKQPNTRAILFTRHTHFMSGLQFSREAPPPNLLAGIQFSQDT